MTRIIRLSSLFVCFSSLCLLFCSCGTPTTGSTTGNPSSTATASTPAVTSVANSTPTTQPTQTNCPAKGTARAAVTPAIQPGNHANVFYTYNPGKQIILRRYDVITGKKTDIATIPATIAGNLSPVVANARLTTDGQWIIFHGVAEGQDAIQMVRVDGQELQTLYCGGVNSILLSPDQKSLAFTQQYGDLLKLDMASGQLQTETKAPAPQEPAFYQPVKWRDNSSLYVTKELVGVGGGSPYPMRNRVGLYLLQDTSKDASQQSTNLQQIMLPNGWAGRAEGDVDMNQDHIVTNVCPRPAGTLTGLKGPCSIMLQQSTGAASTVYNDANHAIVYVRFASNSKLLFATENITPGPQGVDFRSNNVGLWEINTDGTGLKSVATLPDNKEIYLHELAYTPASTVSNDGTMAAIETLDSPSTPKVARTLYVCPLNGSAPMPFASASQQDGTATLIGWSTF